MRGTRSPTKSDRSRHGVMNLLVCDTLPKVAVSGAMPAVYSATWPSVCPAEVRAVQDSVESHEAVIEDTNMGTARVRMVVFTLTCVRQ